MDIATRGPRHRREGRSDIGHRTGVRSEERPRREDMSRGENRFEYMVIYMRMGGVVSGRRCRVYDQQGSPLSPHASPVVAVVSPSRS